ncbi:hypothetical protein ACQEU5_09240 [Marinactinospora thermotolerans]|uniref:hypothetical protein n=1 Tax=Marinactinospora thermotolerans TaxID=531310 RepID=UPI003D8B50E5
MAGRNARTNLLMPEAKFDGAGTNRGKARARWAQGEGLTEVELVGLLSMLRFDLPLGMVCYQEKL